MAKAVKKYSSKFFAITLIISTFGMYLSLVDRTNASQVTSRSDTLSNAIVSTSSNHTVVFTVQDAIATVGGLSSTFTITFTSFNLSAVKVADIDVATTTQFDLNVDASGQSTWTPPTVTSWGVTISGSVISLTSPMQNRTWVPVGTAITVKVGTNAITQNTGVNRIVNPSSDTFYVVSVGGTFGGTGDMIVPITKGVTVSATVTENLTLTIAGLPGRNLADNVNSLDYCINRIASAQDNDDNATIGGNLVTTVATAVPFGTVSAGALNQGCQRVSVKTNAAGGFTVNTQEDHSMMTGSGQAIPDTLCDSGSCTPTTAASFTVVSTGLGISCSNVSSIVCSSTFGTGNNWAPISSADARLSTAPFMSYIGSVSGSNIMTKAKFRLSVPYLQGGGTYTNTVTYIATGTF
jgi:hypothetical protein